MNKLWQMLQHYMRTDSSYSIGDYQKAELARAVTDKLSPLIEKWKRIAEKPLRYSNDEYEEGLDQGEINMAREVLEDLGVAYTPAEPRNQS